MQANKNLLKQQNSFQTVICELCNIATVLDPASATELLTMNDEPEQQSEEKYYQEEAPSEEQAEYINQDPYVREEQMNQSYRVDNGA